ncbi:MAG TPA: 2-C-methyl-D-erythritol 2,4-cyclodiphosphate synthase [Methylococcaceae bacterium]|jgi:2-C-methyl-D-erythritol 2,4-cyclodiphosphate synthase|nr:2-C-methyl-D-erythritol 2,4-cyclodiphosphate synthase [Methylococcaceae bacterium]
MLRIGQGYDAHRFKEGDHIVIGGVTIPFEKGMAAHSDGDVALHALCDALLGAAALGDIGKHFPDSDAKFKGIDSRILVRDVSAKLAGLGFAIVNVDLTVIAQAPKLASHIPLMRENIAADLAVPVDCVNVKATTTEGMGFEGRGEGISAMAVALIRHTKTASAIRSE